MKSMNLENLSSRDYNMDEYTSRRRKRRSRYFTGEDIDMLRERERERKRDSHRNICDTNIDGA